MGFASPYLIKAGREKNLIESAPPSEFGIAVIIPCFDEPSITRTLESLMASERPDSIVEVLILFNYPEGVSEGVLSSHLMSYNKTVEWIGRQKDSTLQFHAIDIGALPYKYAGPGMVRKLGMDEAISRFNLFNRPAGIIVSLDADTLCDRNYLAEIERYFQSDPTRIGCSIYFEHPISGEDYDSSLYDGITQYELHLRYHIQALRYICFPHAYHTIGSAFAVRADIYCRQGGMNRRRAGEDFYFLHKFIPLGGYGDLTGTRVVPSPRISTRVPFGTGSGMKDILKNDPPVGYTYNFGAYLDLGILFRRILEIELLNESGIGTITRNLPQGLSSFLEKLGMESLLREIVKNTGSDQSFRKRFFRVFNAFQVIKYLNWVHFSDYFEKKPVSEMAYLLLDEMDSPCMDDWDTKKLLELYRKLDRTGPNYQSFLSTTM